MLHVATEILDRREPLRVIEAVLCNADIAEPSTRRTLGVFWREALRAESFRFEIDMRTDLVFKISLRSAAEHQASPSVALESMTRAIDSTRRFHRPVSTVSCFRPAAV